MDYGYMGGKKKPKGYHVATNKPVKVNEIVVCERKG